MNTNCSSVYDLRLQRFCERAELDIHIVSGIKTHENNGFDSYRVVGKGEISGLVVRAYGRFGNNVLQLAQAIQFARRHGLRWVAAVNFGPMFRVGRHTLKDGLLICVGETFHSLGGGIEGHFFFWWGCGGGLRGMQGDSLARVIRNELRFIINIRFLNPDKQPTIHCHIRSGDIFSHNKSSIHPNYVQPPLSYYLKAVERRMEKTANTYLVIISEDNGNPVVQSLLDRAKKRGWPVEIQSSSEQNDIERLISAKEVVCGFGTFMPVIGLLSSNITHMIFFRDFQQKLALESIGVHVDRIIDVCGNYIARGTWCNTLEQREQMLTYPIQYLHWDDSLSSSK